MRYPALVAKTKPTISVSDADRDVAVQRLREAVEAGHLELEEFSDRVDSAFTAFDHDALALVTHDLPALRTNTVEPVQPALQRRPTGWILGVMGGGDRRGRWKVAERLRVLNLMGGADLDLRSASITAKVTNITVFSVMGGSTIRVPDGIDVELSGFAVMGSNRLRLTGPHPPEGSPLLVVRAYSIMGGTEIKGERIRRREQRRRAKG